MLVSLLAQPSFEPIFKTSPSCFSTLLRMAWPPFSGGPRSVDTQVLTLRRKLEQAGLGDGGGITTVRQQGYRFSLENIRD